MTPRTVGLLGGYRLRLGCVVALVLAACATPPAPPTSTAGASADAAVAGAPSRLSGKGSEVTLFALGLIDTGYRFGGKNPQAGLDCSGMVSYIFQQGAGVKVSGSAAEIARQGRSVDRDSLRPGDLVFFNTRNAPYSHVGVYIGENRFVHAPSGSGRVRVDELGNRYYAQRFEAARTYFD